MVRWGSRCPNRSSSRCATTPSKSRFFDMSTAEIKTFEFYFVVVIGLLLALVATNRVVASRYGPRVRGAARRPDRVGLHGGQRIQAQGDRVRIQRRAGGAGGGVVRLLGAVCRTQQLRHRARDPVPAGGRARCGRKSRVGPILGAIIIVMLPNLLADIFLFRVMAGIVAAVALIPGIMVLGAAHRGPLPHADPGRAVPRVLRLLAAARPGDGLQARDLRGDDPVRRVLPAGRHLRLRPRRPRPVAGLAWCALTPLSAPAATTRTCGRRPSPRCRKGKPLLEAQRCADAVRRAEGAERGVAVGDAAHHPRADRAERLGQEHNDERADRHLRAHRGPHPVGRAGDHRAQVAGDRGWPGSRAPFRTCSCSANSR